MPPCASPNWPSPTCACHDQRRPRALDATLGSHRPLGRRPRRLPCGLSGGTPAHGGRGRPQRVRRDRGIALGGNHALRHAVRRHRDGLVLRRRVPGQGGARVPPARRCDRRHRVDHLLGRTLRLCRRRRCDAGLARPGRWYWASAVVHFALAVGVAIYAVFDFWKEHR